MDNAKDSTLEACKALHARGAHLFVFHVERDPEDPTRKKYELPGAWQSEPWTWKRIERALRHGGGNAHVGLVGGSLELTIPDIDVKDGKDAVDRQRLGIERCGRVTSWAGETPCIMRSPTGGLHCYYRRREPHPKMHDYAVLGKGRKLEIFGDTGFVELYDPERLLKHLDALPVFGGTVTPRANGHDPGPPEPSAGTNGNGVRGRTVGDRNQGLNDKVYLAYRNDADPEVAAGAAWQVYLAAVTAEEAAVPGGKERHRAEGEKTYNSARRAGLRDRDAKAQEPPDDPAPAPEPPPAPPEDVELKLERWRGRSRPQAMPEPPPARTLPGEKPFRYDQPCEHWELAHHWALHTKGTWLCELHERTWRWAHFTREDGWQYYPSVMALNAVKAHARKHYHAWDKKAEALVQNPHAGVSNTITKPAEETARGLQGIAIEPGSMDRDPFLTGLPGGQVVDARARRLVEATHEHRVTLRAGAAPGEDGTPCELERMLEYHVECPLERMWLGCYLGRAFIGGRDREMLILPGEKFTRKSTVVEAVDHAFGDYARTVDAQDLLTTAGSSHTGDSTRAQLHGKRLVTLSEGEAESKLNARAVKQLVSDDTITGRLMKGGNTVEVEPTWSFLFALNWIDFPTMDPEDEAAWSRVVVLPFENPLPPADRLGGYVRTLKQPKEAAGIVAWLLRHAWLWAEHGMPPQSRRMRRAANRQREASATPFARFLQHCTTLDPSGKLWLTDLKKAFVRWCTDQHEPADVSAKAMGAVLRKCAGVSVKRGSAGRTAVFGLRLDGHRTSP